MPGAQDSQVRDWLAEKLIHPLVSALVTSPQAGPCLLLFDNYERLTTTTETWLLQTLLPTIRDDHLTNALAVIAGERLPQFDSRWRSVVEMTELGGLPLPAIQEYWVQLLGRPEAELEFAARFSNGHPMLLAQMADNAARFPDLALR
jgi:hypothetical protein